MKSRLIEAFFGLAAAALVLWLGHATAIEDRKGRIDSLSVQLAELQAKIQEGRAAKQELPRYREQVRDLERESDAVLAGVPKTVVTADVLERLRSLAKQHGLEPKRLQPAVSAGDSVFNEHPLKVTLRGSSGDLVLFFRELRGQPQIFAVGSLHLRILQSEENWELAQADMVVTVLDPKQ